MLKLDALAFMALFTWLALDIGGAPTFAATLPLGGRSEGSAQSISTGIKLYLPVVSHQDPPPPPPPGGLTPIYWDSRLGPGGLPGLENIRIIPASVRHLQRFWRVVAVVFENVEEAGNDHTIYVKVVDEYGNRLSGKQAHFTGTYSGVSDYPSEKPAGDLCDCNFDFPLFGDAYNAEIVADGYPSDIMAGMISPEKRHVNYRITFQRTTYP